MIEKKKNYQLNEKNFVALPVKGFATGIILCAILSVVSIYSANILRSGDVSATLTTPLVIFLFFVMIGVIHPVLRILNRKFSFSRTELLLIYIMMLIATAVPTMGFIGQLLPAIVTPYYYATPQNRWAELIQPYLPRWLTIQDSNAIQWFFEGLPKGEAMPWKLWIMPLSFWIIFMLIFYFVTVCIMVILRKQWIENEKLVYPIVQLPMEMTRGQGKNSLAPPFLKNKIMWLGFAIPFLIGVVTGLSHYFPFISRIELYHAIPIFRRTGSLIFYISFPLMGFVYLAKTEVSFSVWFFALFFLILNGFFTITGIELPENTGPYSIKQTIFAYQIMGALIIFVLYRLWIAREHLKDVFRKAVKNKNIDDSAEIISYSAAFWGLIIGLILMWLWLRMTGLSSLPSIIFLFTVFIIFIGLTRVIVETGIPYVVAPLTGAAFVISIFGSNNLGSAGLVAIALTYIWAGDLCIFLMPCVAHSLEITTKEIKIKKVFVLWAIILALVIAIFISVYVTLFLVYKHGGINLSDHFYKSCPQWPFNFIAEKFSYPDSPSIKGWVNIFMGGLVMLFLMAMRQKFLWWPFHPVGFLLGATWFMQHLWFSVFLSWLIKSFILKYGGHKVYEKSKFFFLGLILGQFTAVGLWLIVDFFTGTSGNTIFWI